MKMDKDRKEDVRLRTMAEFAAQKTQMLSDHAFLTLLGATVFWSCFNLQGTASYFLGALLGGLFIYLQQRAVDSVGATTIEEVSRLPPAIVAPILLVGIVAKNTDTLALLPAFAGFFTHQLAIVAQLAYPSGWGLPPLEEEPPPAAEA